MDARGGQHPVSSEALTGALVDPFGAHRRIASRAPPLRVCWFADNRIVCACPMRAAAAGGAALLARLNGGADAQAAHLSLCEAYLGVRVAQAFIFSVDRTGFSMLGCDGAPGAPWREFRFAFSNEVRDAAGLEATLRDMAAEAHAHLAGEAKQ